MEKRDFDVLILGGGPGGYTAALYCARAGYSVAVVEKMTAGGQMATTERVDNYPGFEDIDGFELGERMRRGAENAGAVTVYEEVRAVFLKESPKRAVTSGGVLTGRAVILATGAIPRKLGVKGEETLTGKGVAYCATCDGARYRGKTVAVAGGGNSAVTDALTLSKLCAKVYLIHRRDVLRASKAYADELLRSGAEILFNHRVIEIVGEGSVRALILEDTVNGTRRELALDAIFIAVGRDPETGFLHGQVRLDDQGYIVADESTRTDVEGVFAVGDARVKEVRQIVTAAADGAIAAYGVEAFLR